MKHDDVDVAALDALFDGFKHSDTPGLVAGVAHQGRVLYRRAFGMASIEHGVANAVRTRMRIGSTSKHFTCLAALLLAEEGRLDLNDGVRRHIPELRPFDGGTAEPTLRQLMTHTGGLRDSLDVGFLASGMAIKPRGESMAVQVRQRDANFPPGDKTLYNNGGYHLLSHAIARASGMPFERFLAERIFAPLGMADTESVPSDLVIVPGMATLHVPCDGGWRRGVFPSEEVLGEGGIVSTVDDMLRWLAHLRAPGLVGSAATWAEMTSPARLNNGMLTTYALGLMVERHRGVEVIHHGGTVVGGHCQMVTVPSHALDVILISNGIQASLFDLANQVIETVLGPAAFSLAPHTPAQTGCFAQLVGSVYASESGDTVIGFDDAGGKLGLRVHNSPPIPMRLAPGALVLDFNRSATGPYSVAVDGLGAAAPATLEFVDGGTTHRLDRLPAAPPVAQAGHPLVGRYRAPDLGADAVIAFEGGALRLRIAGEYGPSVLELLPYSADLFGWRFGGDLAPLGGTLVVERDDGATGPVRGLRLNTLRTRHMLLQRIGD